MDLDWEGLTVAFAARSMLMNHFLDRASGEVHAHLNGSPELREALLHERSGRYLRIPKSTPDVDAARCRAFAPKMEDAAAREKALRALESGGPRAFRDVLLAFPNDESGLVRLPGPPRPGGASRVARRAGDSRRTPSR